MKLSLTRARRDSVLDWLPAEARQKLEGWLTEGNKGDTEVVQLAAAELGVTTSRSALSRYYRKHIALGRLIEVTMGSGRVQGVGDATGES